MFLTYKNDLRVDYLGIYYWNKNIKNIFELKISYSEIKNERYILYLKLLLLQLFQN